MEVLTSGKVDESYKNSPKGLKDKRIRAFFAICPAIGQGFVSKSQFKELDNPVYIVGAQADSIAPCKTNALTYHRLITEIAVLHGKRQGRSLRIFERGGRTGKEAVAHLFYG